MSDSTPAIAVSHLVKNYAGVTAVSNVSSTVAKGEILGFLGPNGAGKSTLLKVMAGLDTEINGEAWAAKGVRVGYLEQEPHLDPNKTVEENVTDGLGEVKDLMDRFNEISAKFAEPMDDEEMNAVIA